MMRFALPILPLLLAGAAFASDTTVAVPAAPTDAPVPSAAPANAPTVAAKPIVVTGNKEVKAPWNGEKITCTRVAPVGSLIPVRHCTTKSEDKTNREAAQDILNRPIAGNMPQ